MSTSCFDREDETFIVLVDHEWMAQQEQAIAAGQGTQAETAAG